jgi:acylphosphatase
MKKKTEASKEPADTRIKRVHVYISGRVQGVCFRAYTQDEASSLGLSGWVRNIPGGRVEAVFQGPPALVDEMVKWCWKGSPYAAVDSVDLVDEAPRTDEPAGFRVRY